MIKSISKIYFILLNISFILVSENALSQERLIFTSSDLNEIECENLFIKKVITKKKPVPCDRLNRVNFSYMNEHGVIKSDGVIIVFDVLAPKVTELMKKLLKNNFKISKSRPIEEYGGDDIASMEDNNTSSFNGRAIAGDSRWSLHAYGAAIDINPMQNPFIEIEKDGTAKVSPSKSAHYAVNRLNYRPGKSWRPGMAEEVVGVFAEHGFFVWGGYWNYPVDYQHFQVGPRSFVKELTAVSPENGKKLLNNYISMYLNCIKVNESESIKSKIRAKCIDIIVGKMP